MFHGTYTARIVLAFADAAAAAAGLAAIEANGCSAFGTAASEPRAIVGTLDSAALAAFKDAWCHAITIAPCGWRHCKRQCKTAAIDSLAHSVDVGPVFTLDTAAVKTPPKPKRAPRPRKATKREVAIALTSTDTAAIDMRGETCPYCSRDRVAGHKTCGEIQCMNASFQVQTGRLTFAHIGDNKS
jgi:hypothetical protein